MNLESAMRLVVMISSQDGGSGSGIVFAANDRELDIVTARHVVLDRTNKPYEGITVWVRDDPSEPHTAKVLEYDVNLDLCIIRITDARLHGALPFRALGNTSDLRPGSKVQEIGFVHGEKWFTSYLPEVIDRLSATTVTIQSSTIDDGSSGGPVLSDNRIVAMVQQKAPAKALFIDEIMRQLVAWQLHPDLTTDSEPAITASPTSSLDGASTISSQLTFNPALKYATESPKKLLSFADFTSEDISGVNLQITPGNGFEYNSTFLNTWRITIGGGGFTAAFSAPASGTYSLIVSHLSSCVTGSRGDGYSPVTIKLNSQTIADDYDPASAHGGSHRMLTDRWPIVARSGQNELQWTMGEAASAHYWLQSIIVARDGVVPVEKPGPRAACAPGAK